ncbi:MAG: T9SS type A sorting domain-containing protein [Bacteroidota bacterium]
MVKILISLLLIFLCNCLPGQGTRLAGFLTDPENNKNIAQDALQKEIVYTPFGPALRNNVHYVDDDHYLIVKNGAIEKVQTKTGETINRFDNISGESGVNHIFKSEKYNIHSELISQEGWITHAECQIYISDPRPAFLSAEWTVPNHPLRISNQTIFLFDGLIGIKPLNNDHITFILQPVLQWGESAAGGGQYWAICNWLVTNKGQFFFDTLFKVNSGDKLQGVIKLISYSDTSYDYNSSFTEYSKGLDVYNLPNMGSPCFALEAYNIKGCEEYPAIEKIRMSNIQIRTDSVYPPLIWQIFNDVDNCGQFTNIIDESSDNGEVNIHFRKPHSPDGFEGIYLYPNPVSDYVHFSITDPLFNCRIEIYNNLGNLIHTEIYKTLEYGYDLNFQNHGPGLYLIKFYFQKDLITREASHTFKIIKL